ncbi:MAG TPA: phosphoribosylglycinamide synthetase C domain-containing protein [Bacillota bacterium]|nr:phosphoribosylglycinamide synthetase C domain-containing protein [Bacillota bacterium]
MATSGGRVLAISALGKDVNEATGKAYRIADRVQCANLFTRSDIGSGRKK